MEPSEFEICLSVESYDKKTAQNCLNFYDAGKRLISELSNISMPNFDRTILRLDSKLSEFLVPVFYTF